MDSSLLLPFGRLKKSDPWTEARRRTAPSLTAPLAGRLRPEFPIGHGLGGEPAAPRPEPAASATSGGRQDAYRPTAGGDQIYGQQRFAVPVGRLADVGGRRECHRQDGEDSGA